MSEMSHTWARIERWLSTKAKRPAAKLRPGATQASIAAVEDVIGMRFPRDLRLSFRQHDGAPDSALLPAVEDDDMGFSLLHLEQVVAEWKVLSDGADQIPKSHISADEGVRAANWCTRWIPVASNACGDFFCIDLSPAKGGTVGQVIALLHETSERKLLARSWSALLRDLAEGLESRRYRYHRDNGIHRPRRDPTPSEMLPENDRLIASADFSRTEKMSDPVPDQPLLAAFDKIDKSRTRFGPPCEDYYAAFFQMLRSLMACAMRYFGQFAPREQVELNGYTLFTIPQVVQANRAVFVKHQHILVFGRTPTGDHLAFDSARSDIPYFPMIVSIPADVAIAKVSKKKIAAKSTVLGERLSVFLRGLVE